MSSIAWRPNLPVSNDGEPLTVAISDLFWTFPYERLPSNANANANADAENSPSNSNSAASLLLSFFLRPESVLAMVIVYLILAQNKGPLTCWVKRMGITGKSKEFMWAVAIHNLSLAIFSGIVMVNTWIIVLDYLRKEGFSKAWCDPDGALYATSGFGAWSTIFYLSKYWEFVDTFILIFKGKEASFLQVFHHTGIALALWGGTTCQASWTLFVVLLNSAIHTAMYIYFFIKTIDPMRKIPAARYLTQAQILQFIVGILGSLGVYFFDDSCVSPASRFVLVLLHSYVVGLIFLFTNFAAKKYKKV